MQAAMGRASHVLLVVFCLLTCAIAQNNSTGFNSDPILDSRPVFARSLPTQILLIGIVFSLSSVLLIHLLFTGQYHWGLAPVNYALQITAVTTLLTSNIATLCVVFTQADEQSRSWPYMLNYVAVDIPPVGKPDWSIAAIVAWLLMNATTCLIIQITHIQFLTLLFPSDLEKKLIFLLLGPLAATSAVMQMLRVHQGSRLEGIAADVQNVCNATLSLLFTISLLLWGLLVNRRQAWRTDGGTAAFGLGALTLAPMSTAISFFYIPTKDQFMWVSPLMWSVILWQSFLGWWWWVGAGMGVGEVDELLQREEKRLRKRRMRLQRQKLRRERAETLWKGVTGVFHRAKSQDGDDAADAEAEERLVISRKSSTTSCRRSAAESESTVAPNGPFARLWNHPASRFVYGIFLQVRHAHLAAAREQAVEQVERIHQVYGENPEAPGRSVRRSVGWGLGSFGIKRSVQPAMGRRIQDRPYDHQDSYELDSVKVHGGVESEDGISIQSVRRRTPGQIEEGTSPRTPAFRPSSMWWWGPLQRWRLQDSTDYSQ